MRSPLRRLHLGDRPYRWQALVRHDPGRRVLRIRVWGPDARGGTFVLQP